MADELIDLSRLSLLAQELGGDTAACVRFVDDFVTAWAPRRDRVVDAVGRPVVTDALATLLTLSTSSAMLGIGTLSAVAARVHDESRGHGTVSAAAADELVAVGTASVGVLQAVVERWRATLDQPAESDPVSR